MQPGLVKELSELLIVRYGQVTKISEPAPAGTYGRMVGSFGSFHHIERKRLTSKLLTILARDHGLLSAISTNDDALVLARQLYLLTMKNLHYFYPVFLEYASTFDKQSFEDNGMNERVFLPGYCHDNEQTFNDFEQEVKARVSQELSLL